MDFELKRKLENEFLVAINSNDLLKVAEIINRIDINFFSFVGLTPLNYAIRDSNIEMALFIIKNCNDDVIHFKNKFLNTYLHNAVEVEEIEIVKLLVERGADVNSKNAKGMTPLYYSILLRNFEITKYLLSHGADPYIPTNEGKTPYDISKYSILKYINSLPAGISVKAAI